MTFRKGDRVVVAAVGSAVGADEASRLVGQAGTVQQSRQGGAVAVVALDNRDRVSIYQRDLLALQCPLCGDVAQAYRVGQPSEDLERVEYVPFRRCTACDWRD